MEEFMKKFFVLLGTLAIAALFFSCANSSDDNSAALLGLQNPATKNTVSKTIKIGGAEYSYTTVDGQPQASGGVSVAADGTVTITAADGSKVAVKGDTITYTTADSKVYVGSGSSGDITLANRDNPNDKITATFSSQTKTESPQQQSEASRLPPSVGTNELAGKTFAGTKYEEDTYTTTTIKHDATANNTAYVEEWIFSYTYNSNLKVIYYKDSGVAYVRNGVRTILPEENFSTDAEFISYQKNYFKLQYDLASDDYIETLAKQTRVNRFAQYGYTDTSCETPVSNEIIAKYNEWLKLKKKSSELISTKSYSVSDTGVKFESSDRYPEGKDFNELFPYYRAPWQIKDSSGNTAYSLHCSFAIAAAPMFFNKDVSLQYHQIMAKSDGLLAYKVSSVDANAIHTCATGTRTNTTSDFSFTDENKTFKYTMTKSENGAVVDIEGLGKINIVYATPATIPDFTSAMEFPLQQ